MDRQLDVLFVHPNSAPIYQNLRNVYSAMEPPTWALLLAQSCRRAGYGVFLLDCDANNLSDEDAVGKIKAANPRLVVFVVYGSEPNQGTVRTASAVPLAEKLRDYYPEYKICFVGSHVQALPLEVLQLPFVDYICQNEGVYTLRQLLDKDSLLPLIKGLGFKVDGRPHLNDPSPTVPQEVMDRDLPGHAWDLVDFQKTRSHFWHAQYKHENRTPFAALYTSLGCIYRCNFCMISLINRNNNASHITASDSPGMRWWTAEHTLKQFDYLLDRGIRNIRISDEMFFLNKKHYEPIIEGLIQRNQDDALNLWAYARVDTVRPGVLKKFRQAGIKWLALGVESGNQYIRREASKGSFEDVDIREVFREIEEAGIHPICNIIFGLPLDTLQSMNETLNLAEELDAPMCNMYPAMALPGTQLYQKAKEEGKLLPDSYTGFGFLSYECQPLGTGALSPAEILAFRDAAFHHYYSREIWQSKIEKLFGPEAKKNIQEMCKLKLKRKLLESKPPTKIAPPI